MITTTTENPHYSNGYQAGEAAGSWVIDGNTSEDAARAILTGYEDGDPQIMDMQSSPLSGEWAGESMPELLGDDYTDADADEYETGFSDGYWTEVQRACQSVLS